MEFTVSPAMPRPDLFVFPRKLHGAKLLAENLSHAALGQRLDELDLRGHL
jgi:hypothetical protein